MTYANNALTIERLPRPFQSRLHFALVLVQDTWLLLCEDVHLHGIAFCFRFDTSDEKIVMASVLLPLLLLLFLLLRSTVRILSLALSGCGIMPITLPSSLHIAAMRSVDPFGLSLAYRRTI